MVMPVHALAWVTTPVTVTPASDTVRPASAPASNPEAFVADALQFGSQGLSVHAPVDVFSACSPSWPTSIVIVCVVSPTHVPQTPAEQVRVPCEHSTCDPSRATTSPQATVAPSSEQGQLVEGTLQPAPCWALPVPSPSSRPGRLAAEQAAMALRGKQRDEAACPDDGCGG